MTLIGILVSIVHKSLFMSGDTGFRTAHPISKLAFLVSLVALLAKGPSRVLAITPVILLLGAVHPGYEWVAASAILSGLVGLYMGTSAYLLSLLGLYEMGLFDVVNITLRTFSFSVSTIFVFNSLSPLEFYNVLLLLGARRASSYPILVWRFMPQGLKNFVDSLMVGYLKKERSYKRLPSAVASFIEIRKLVDEYCYWRIRTQAKVTINIDRDQNYTFMLLVASLAIALINHLISIHC